jgi:hypothetical protein
MNGDDLTALSHWFPKIRDAALPVPRTALIDMPIEAQKDAWEAFDGKDGNGGLQLFAGSVAEIGATFGVPFFLRTDHTSGKHSWRDACFVADPVLVIRNIMAIIEYSEMCSIVGLPYARWAIREMLPTIPFGVCPEYLDMPICKEFRFFVDDAKVRCWHPYWPRLALERGGAMLSDADYAALCEPGGDLEELTDLAQRAGAAVGGAWSVDILQTTRGWFVTDMAEAGKSFHWEGCPTRKPTG